MSDIYGGLLYGFVGDLVRQKRTQIGVSQEELAGKIGLARVSVVNIERGRQRPPLHVLWLIAEVLGVELRDLIPLHLQVTSEPLAVHPAYREQMNGLVEKDWSVVASMIQRVARKGKEPHVNENK